ncbi:hypothetical protein [Oceanispirochaeta sp. M1]|uniref:hypothetical protein n=1 Tax=Oceanispirochaeta sp. M1 TaxID=2283433 RepID=UPI0014954045|nr:hypothetical protein [Oceanispirochaeta sp. M1]
MVYEFFLQTDWFQGFKQRFIHGTIVRNGVGLVNFEIKDDRWIFLLYHLVVIPPALIRERYIFDKEC